MGAYGREEDVTKKAWVKSGIQLITIDTFESNKEFILNTFKIHNFIRLNKELKKFDADYSNQQKYDVLKNFAQLNVGDYEAQALNDANKAINQQAEQQLNSAEVITDSDGQSIDLQ